MALSSVRSAWLPVAILLTAAALAWFLLHRSSAQSDEPPMPTAEVDATGGLVLSAVQAESLGLRTAAAEAASTIAISGLPAEVAPPLDASARVAAPYAGIVTRILMDEGQVVAAGDALVRIQSRELLAARATLVQARSEAAAAAQQAQRDAALLQEGIIAAAKSEQSQARAATAQAARQEAEGALAGLRMTSDGVPGEYELLSPIAGRILRRKIVPGQAIAALEETYIIATPGSLDLIFNVPVDLRSQLTPGLGIRLPDGGSGEVVAVGADTDRASQSLRLRARADDAPGLVAGQHLQVTLLMPAPAGSLAVPGSALLSLGRQHMLYVHDGERYRAVRVERLGGADDRSIVRGEIQPGMQVVVQGASALKALLTAE